jgi:hypothetical protein
LGEAYLSQALNLEVDHKTVDKDLYAQAFQWTSKAAEQGLVNAQSRLGELYHEGWGVTKSHTLAMQWYRKVTSGGHHNVLFNIGQLYEHGDGVKASRVVADALYHLSGIYEASDPNGDHEHPITGGALLFDLETKMSTQEKAAASKLTEDMFKAKDPLIALDQYVAHPTVVEVLVYSPENGKKSLCADTEDSLFSCATKTRFISLCASKNLSVTSGTMQYRVEKEGKLEFTFPENNVQPSTVFFNGTDGFGRANLSSIVFHNGEYSYLLYTIHDKFIPYSGVEIQRGEKLISALTCLNDTDGFDPNEVEMKKAELPVAPQ